MAMGDGLWYVKSCRWSTYFPPMLIARSPVPMVTVRTGGAIRCERFSKAFWYSERVERRAVGKHEFAIDKARGKGHAVCFPALPAVGLRERVCTHRSG